MRSGSGVQREPRTVSIQSTQPVRSNGFFFLLRCSSSKYLRNSFGKDELSPSMKGEQRYLVNRGPLYAHAVVGFYPLFAKVDGSGSPM